MSFATEHADAYKDIAENGDAVTLTGTSRNFGTGLDGRSTPSVGTLSGVAVRSIGNPKVYERLKLIAGQAISLLFAADTYGDTPTLGMTLPFGGETYTIRDVEAIAPDGVTIVSKLVAAK